MRADTTGAVDRLRLRRGSRERRGGRRRVRDLVVARHKKIYGIKEFKKIYGIKIYDIRYTT